MSREGHIFVPKIEKLQKRVSRWVALNNVLSHEPMRLSAVKRQLDVLRLAGNGFCGTETPREAQKTSFVAWVSSR